MVMAKRTYSKKGRKIEPAIHQFIFSTPTPAPGAVQTSYIDLSQCASLLNRRFYRQGINWVVAGFKVKALRSGKVTIGKLPNTWIMSNSWEKGFRAWQKMNEDAMAESESVRPKFLDFKIYADSTHHTAGFGDNLLPMNYASADAIAGEWESSKVNIPDSTSPAGAVYSREILATGSNYPGAGASGLNAISLIEGYAASRALPDIEDPNTPDDAASADGAVPQNWLSALFNDGTSQDDATLTDLITENNLAPYPFENDGVNADTMYPGGANQLIGLEFHDFTNIVSFTTTVGNVGTQYLKGGTFPCGLIRVDWTPNESTNLIIQVDLVPGHHRGYLCEPMTEM